MLLREALNQILAHQRTAQIEAAYDEWTETSSGIAKRLQSYDSSYPGWDLKPSGSPGTGWRFFYNAV